MVGPGHFHKQQAISHPLENREHLSLLLLLLLHPATAWYYTMRWRSSITDTRQISASSRDQHRPIDEPPHQIFWGVFESDIIQRRYSDITVLRSAYLASTLPQVREGLGLSSSFGKPHNQRYSSVVSDPKKVLDMKLTSIQ